MIDVTTKSAEDTRELGAQVAAMARPGDIVLLSGDLGAGKTTFAQGFGRGLGVEEQVVSPTFTLMRTYPARIPLVHCDVYRLDRLQEVVDLAIPEMLDQGGVALVEWGDMAAPALPADFLEARFEFGEGDDDRHLRFRVVGPSWAARTTALRLNLGRWTQ